MDLAGLGDIERALLAGGLPGTVIVENRVYAEAAVTTELSEEATRVLALLEGDPLSPPDMPLSDRAALRDLEHRGLACQVGPIWLATSAIESAIAILTRLLESAPDGFTVSEAREALGTSRKYALPLLGHLDTTGITRRHGDRRVAGSVLLRQSDRAPATGAAGNLDGRP